MESGITHEPKLEFAGKGLETNNVAIAKPVPTTNVTREL